MSKCIISYKITRKTIIDIDVCNMNYTNYENEYPIIFSTYP